MGRIIVVSIGKGGVGKTSSVANLGIMLAKHNKSVCVVDGDFGLNNLDVALNLENRVVYDIMDAVQGNCRLSQALVKDPLFSNLYLLPSMRMESQKFISKEAFAGVILDLERVFEYVVIDSPAGIDYGYERAILPANEVLIVVTPTISAIRDAGKAILKAKEVGAKQIQVIVNRCQQNLVDSGQMLSYRDVENLLGESVVGIVPENVSLCIGNSLKTVFETDEELANAFSVLEKNIVNFENKIYEPRQKTGRVLGAVKSIFKGTG